MKKVIRWILGGLLVIALAVQLYPYGRDHTNPPVTAEPAWNSPATRELAQRACFDCHSNETKWPWYSNIAPVSWLIQRDVEEGRAYLNFSEWDRPQHEAGEAWETVQVGYMPPPYYINLHPEADLSQAEQDALINGLRSSLARRR